MHARFRLAALLAIALAVSPARGQEVGAPSPLPADTEVVEVGPIDVTVLPPSERGKLAGFYRRMRRGQGHFITREEIEARDPFRLTDLVHLAPGFQTVSFGDGSGRRHARMGRATVLESLDRCRVRYWLDGHPVHPASDFELDLVPPGDVGGIEVYRGVSETPVQFRPRGAICGVVVIWTRDPSRP